MSATLINSNFLFGLVEAKPAALPEGWRYVESASDFLKCASPAGDQYFVCTDGLRFINRAPQIDGPGYEIDDVEAFPQ